MKKCVPVLLFSVLSASVASHADSNVFQQKAEKTKNGIVADVNARQKMFSNRLKIQLQIDELRAELAGTRDAQKERICVKTGVSGAAKEILTLMGAYFPRFLP